MFNILDDMREEIKTEETKTTQGGVRETQGNLNAEGQEDEEEEKVLTKEQEEEEKKGFED